MPRGSTGVSRSALAPRAFTRAQSDRSSSTRIAIAGTDSSIVPGTGATGGTVGADRVSCGSAQLASTARLPEPRCRVQPSPGLERRPVIRTGAVARVHRATRVGAANKPSAFSRPASVPVEGLRRRRERRPVLPEQRPIGGTGAALHKSRDRAACRQDLQAPPHWY